MAAAKGGMTLEAAGAEYGKATKAKFTDASGPGEPEEQLRSPVERLVGRLAELSGFGAGAVTLVGERRLADLKTRPDFAAGVHGALAGFVEVKAPGKGADPRVFTGHDKAQWEKLQSLPNLIYTDGNEWGLWREGELVGEVVRVKGDVRSAGAGLEVPHGLLGLVGDFLRWEPTAPRDAKQLAGVTARLCKLLRAEVAEQLGERNEALTALAKDWRRLLFPEASDEAFADGYAQAVTFGLLMARARGITLSGGLDHVASELRETNSLIGTALRLLTDDAEGRKTLETSLKTLVRVLDAVDWKKVSRGKAEAWLYFYEDFLEVYDNALRKQTGSYYTPPEVVTAMVGMVHEALRTRFGRPLGLGAEDVKVADPAVGTGTFVLGVLRRIAEAVGEDQGEGAVAEAVEAAVGRVIAFEMQLGPFAVAQLRVTGELVNLTGGAPKKPVRMYVTDTLGNPNAEEEEMGALYKPIAESRRQANRIKREEKITVVIGNPPYKEKAKGRGGWVENGVDGKGKGAPLLAWMPPAEWGVGAHAKHLRNLYVYFWRWATWKVFDSNPAESSGVVCFITVAGFLDGDGFQRMREYLRRKADEVWVINCSPEGYQPETNTRVFQGVQQPVCIVMAVRKGARDEKMPAAVKYQSLPEGHRSEKFAALTKIQLDGDGWVRCPDEWREGFLPAVTGAWATFPKLEWLFVDNHSGVMTGRTWVIAPDRSSLVERWDKLIKAAPEKKESLFHPHLAKNGMGDRHVGKFVEKGLGGRMPRPKPIANEVGECETPEHYGFRSFDRQWIIPDNRLINRPNPDLWTGHSSHQIYLTAPTDQSPTRGPALTVTALIPDMHHYNGRGGRAFPLWQDAKCRESNVSGAVLKLWGERLGREVGGEDLVAYVAAVAANPAYTERFKGDLVQPGLRVPLTAEAGLFAEAVGLGREVVWLHTFGERFADEKSGRPAGAPRMGAEVAPRVPKGGAIPGGAEEMPDEMGWDEAAGALVVGRGRVEHVTRGMWEYEVSGKRVLTQWFSYRKKDRAKPAMGDRRPASKLSEVQPAGWTAEYTAELINVLNVIGRLVALEPRQAALLVKVCDGGLLGAAEVREVVAKEPKEKKGRGKGQMDEPGLFVE